MIETRGDNYSMLTLDDHRLRSTTLVKSVKLGQPLHAVHMESLSLYAGTLCRLIMQCRKPRVSQLLCKLTCCMWYLSHLEPLLDQPG